MSLQPLSGVRILDLSRILAGPTCTQLLGDLGADVIKVERPKAGDDTRKWGPPYVKGKDGEDSSESAYYLCANRNKRSIEIDIARPEGQALIRQLLAHCDILVENYKVGGLDKYGLSYEKLRQEFPSLIYCSITGFGQDGPYANRGGYDYLAQGMGGIMSVTGPVDGLPMKVGVAVADVMCGMYASTAILAALRHRDHTGKGQHIDCCLLDTQVAWLVNQATNYLVSGTSPERQGNEHPNIVPYRTFEVSDGHIILAVGNDGQFRKWCEFSGCGEIADDPRFATNEARVKNRAALHALMEPILAGKSMQDWLDGLEKAGVPCGPVNTIEQVFQDPQVQHRGMRIEMDHPLSETGKVPLVGNPVKFSETPVQYRNAPPTLGQHTDEILREILQADDGEIKRLRETGII
ncbi:CaiB/BaiF CoA transferase family protein [Aestuariispira insulae]|uniref:Crotonobetainyl-CoA:carnitine CoA-transferase CaiB-like acyl-CoA transferase n=1 Tax=Aestuariispira insulae TaxID=1461337 RepID=A0A3D9HX30_9PROT|nr:CaiB/BaiF CoA-transferase family protein [Aestuariispira insulae]RED54062.1 crotonobetainyl-CoA:carnitine CoA-transferase CaiB-like acyl-CoA transferase [Aestuariispira insulae]